MTDPANEFDLTTKSALAKTEKILNALEAIRARVGVLDSQMHVVFEIFKYSLSGSDNAELMRNIQQLATSMGILPPIGPAVVGPRRRQTATSRSRASRS